MPGYRLPAFVLCGLCLLAMPVLAQQPNTPLTLQQCIAMAQQQQSDVQQGQYALTAAQARQVQAKSSYYPQVSLSADTRLTDSNLSGNRASTGSNVSVTQNFYDGGLREAKVKRSGFETEQSTASLERTRQTVTFTVTRAYLEVLRAQQLAAVAKSRLTYIEGQRALVQSRVEAGAAAEVDILPIEAQLANARVEALGAKNTTRTAAIQLYQAMGLTPQSSIDIAEVTLAKDPDVPALAECLTQAKAARPEVRQTAATMGAAQSNVQVAKINQRPRPVINGQFDQPVTGDNERNYSVSAGLVFDLFSGGNTRAVYNESMANLRSAEVRAGQVEKNIAAEVETAYLNMEDARERLQASAASVTAAERNMAAQEERYQQGLAIPLDLLNAQVSLTDANSNAVQARYDYYTALAQLDYALGKQGGFYVP